MASKGNERRMVFDIRGKRRHVVKFVYAILALLMGLSLFLVVGPVNIGSILGTSSSGSSASKEFEEQAERIEVRLKKSPEDADLLASLTRARINAANNSYEPAAERANQQTLQQYQLASAAWSKYQRATNEPSAGLALLVAEPLFNLALNNANEYEANMAAAVEAQEIVAAQRPTINSLTTLTLYQFFAFEFKEAHKAEAEALALANDKFERESIENQMSQYEKSAKEVQKQIKAIEKEAQSTGAGGKESLENPLGGLGGGGLGE